MAIRFRSVSPMLQSSDLQRTIERIGVQIPKPGSTLCPCCAL